VTITGADDSIDPKELVGLAIRFPFVEYGILVSEQRVGTPRYPTHAWIEQFADCCHKEMCCQTSMHACGRWGRDLLQGVESIPSSLMHDFDRIQLNLRPLEPFDPWKLAQVLAGIGMLNIFTTKGAGSRYVDEIRKLRQRYLDEIRAEIREPGRPYKELPIPKIRMNTLFDRSGGAGRLPEAWPAPWYKEEDGTYAYHGYSGGLGPDNLQEQLPLIQEAAGDSRYWIDMESGVRSDNDKQFNLGKVAKCLEICEPFIGR
jgi:hypothetical protein